MTKLRVNPGKTADGKTLVVYKENGAIIKATEKGTEVPNTAFYNRLIADKDLIDLDAEKKKRAKEKSIKEMKAAEAKKGEAK